MVGAVVYAVDLASYLAGVSICDNAYVEANVIAKVLASVVGYLLHRSITFRGKKKHTWERQLFFYVALLAFNTVSGSLLLVLLVEVANLIEVFAKLTADAVVIVVSFFLSRSVVFSRAR
jgi:putative flippase GtrA